jgi:hypothetical protein
VEQEQSNFRKKARRFAFRISVKMLSSAFLSFTLVFVTVGSVGLIIQLLPWIMRRGVTDIDPLPILFFAFAGGFGAMYVRFLILKRFAPVRP